MPTSYDDDDETGDDIEEASGQEMRATTPTGKERLYDKSIVRFYVRWIVFSYFDILTQLQCDQSIQQQQPPNPIL